MKFYTAIWRLLKQRGESVFTLCKATGLSTGIVNWDQNMPKVTSAKKVADYFGITVDELIRLAEECDE